jgi:hypothetical protein
MAMTNSSTKKSDKPLEKSPRAQKKTLMKMMKIARMKKYNIREPR